MKAQYSMEFLLVFAFSMLIILPLISIIHSEYNKGREELDVSQAKKIMDKISMTAQNIYYSGYPSRTTLEIYFPRGIDSIGSSVVSTTQGLKSELVFNISQGTKSNSVITVIPFRLNVTLAPTYGLRKILIKAEPGNYVNVTG